MRRLDCARLRPRPKAKKDAGAGRDGTARLAFDLATLCRAYRTACCNSKRDKGIQKMPSITAKLMATLSLSLLGPVPAHAAPAEPDEGLSITAPPCRTPSAPPPRLPVRVEYDGAEVLRYDFNGDGWCDFAYAVPYPFNSKMNSYDLDQLMMLGRAKGWSPVLHGKKPHHPSIIDIPHETLPLYRISLSNIRLIYPGAGGAPYALGLYAGDGEYPDGKVAVWFERSKCTEHVVVHRWDAEIGAFRRSDEATRDRVLDFYYQVVEKPCPGRRPMR
ncbi:hypothetical protein LNV28_21630 [Paucibacter sp. DJ2R-2]|nr:hypothetical protein [Paucibacter sp. DJ4R-1]MCV2440886.1 hypothetical protein [Paucibacter sp. DJ2R-2]